MYSSVPSHPGHLGGNHLYVGIDAARRPLRLPLQRAGASLWPSLLFSRETGRVVRYGARNGPGVEEAVRALSFLVATLLSTEKNMQKATKGAIVDVEF